MNLEIFDERAIRTKKPLTLRLMHSSGYLINNIPSYTGESVTLVAVDSFTGKIVSGGRIVSILDDGRIYLWRFVNESLGFQVNDGQIILLKG